MASFEGTLRIEGDRSEPLAVKAVVDDGALSLAADGVTLGSWPLTVVSAQPRGAGVGLVLDDDHVVIDLPDADQFIAAITPIKKKRKKASSRRVDREQLRRPAGGSPEPEAKSKRKPRVHVPGRVIVILVGALAFIALSLLFSELVGSILLLFGLILVMAGSLGMVESAVALRIPFGLQAMHLIAGGVVLLVVGVFLTLVA
ncbi:MAG: hypothetical protein WB239_05060 [Acidimicrobiia bacterium]